MTLNFSSNVRHFASALENSLNTLEAEWQTPKEPKHWLNVQTEAELNALADFFSHWENTLPTLMSGVLEHIENPDKTGWLLRSIDDFFQTGFEQKRHLQHARFVDQRFALIINETLSVVV